MLSIGSLISLSDVGRAGDAPEKKLQLTSVMDKKDASRVECRIRVVFDKRIGAAIFPYLRKGNTVKIFVKGMQCRQTFIKRINRV